MIWGYAGCWYKELGVDRKHDLMAALRFNVKHGFTSTHVFPEEVREPAVRDAVTDFVAAHELQLSLHPRIPFFEGEPDAARRAADAFLAELPDLKERLR